MYTIHYTKNDFQYDFYRYLSLLIHHQIYNILQDLVLLSIFTNLYNEKFKNNYFIIQIFNLNTIAIS